MLEYEWGSPSPVMLEEESTQGPDQRSHMFDHYGFNEGLVHNDGLFSQPQYHQHPPPTDPTLHYFYDPRAHYAASYAPPHPQHPSFLSLDTASPSAFMMIPKTEEMSVQSPVDFTSRLGLNLGGRTYFSAADDDFMSRLYRRSRPGENGSTGNSPRCQAEGCSADLTHAKHYHRRHKVCEYHSKASTVVAAGLTQRFCQQCSRFHLLSEFDNGKRSCRKRLADHNRRRRKSNQDQPKSTRDGFARSPPDSGAPSSSSMTVRVSPPPRMSLDCYSGRAYQVSSPASSSIFFSS